MLGFLLLSLIPALAFGQNRWYSGNCGESQYSDAGRPVPLGGRVVGGIEARRDEFPYQVQLRLFGAHLCGGSVINREWVLTAAHCLFDVISPNNYGVVVGQHDINRSEGEQVFQIINFYKHEEYGSVLGRDIALIRIAGQFNFDSRVQPVCSPQQNNLYVGYDSVVSGWGAVEWEGAGSNVLLYTNMEVVTNQYCRNSLLGNLYPPPVESEVCAGNPDENNFKDACQGDSGGPLTVKENGLFRLVGVVSHGYECAGGSPGVYARVTSFLDWIDNTIAQNS